MGQQDFKLTTSIPQRHIEFVCQFFVCATHKLVVLFIGCSMSLESKNPMWEQLGFPKSNQIQVMILIFIPVYITIGL